MDTVRRLDGENYVEFNTYTLFPTTAKLKEVIRIYSGLSIGTPSIGASTGTLDLPYVKVVTLGSRRNPINYYELRNSKNEVVFITDQDGVDLLYGLGGEAAVPAN